MYVNNDRTQKKKTKKKHLIYDLSFSIKYTVKKLSTSSSAQQPERLRVLASNASALEDANSFRLVRSGVRPKPPQHISLLFTHLGKPYLVAVCAFLSMQSA